MGTTSIQDRTAEFRTVLAQAQKNLSSRKPGGQRQSLLTDAQRQAVNGSPNGNVKGPRRGARSEFARKAAEVGRGITGTMEKLERLAQRVYADIVHTNTLLMRASTQSLNERPCLTIGRMRSMNSLLSSSRISLLSIPRSPLYSRYQRHSSPNHREGR